MIAIGVEYLHGVAVATHPSDYEAPEWPPHPARVFMALAAAHFEAAGDAPEPSLEERDALRWLESLTPPEIAFPTGSPRGVVRSYVPVNDVKADGVLPRMRQERFFPATVLGEESRVWFVWPEQTPEPRIRKALETLAERVPRVGHSSSFVRVHLADRPESADQHLIPSADGSTRLRIPAPGLLSVLEESFERGQRPPAGTWQGYSKPREMLPDPERSVFDPNLIVLRLREGRSLDLSFTAKITDTLRRAIMTRGGGDLPEVVSGHAPDGSPSQRPHAAFIPLAFVGGEHADGHLMGLAIALPRELSREERFRAVGALSSRLSGTGSLGICLNLGRSGVWDLEVDRSEDPPLNLRPRGYTDKSDRWATVTPLVLDRFAGDQEEQEAIVAASCERIGLPPPAEIMLSKIAYWKSVPPAWEFPPLSAGRGGPKRFHLHAVIRFEQPVEGPVILGAGRYRGYGLCRPIRRGR